MTQELFREVNSVEEAKRIAEAAQTLGGTVRMEVVRYRWETTGQWRLNAEGRATGGPSTVDSNCTILELGRKNVTAMVDGKKTTLRMKEYDRHFNERYPSAIWIYIKFSQ